MNSGAVIQAVRFIQMGLKVVALLQLTAYLWPQHTEVKDGAMYDFIVVGAGTAGSVIANRLTEDPNSKVLVIEAGGDPPLESELPRTVMFMKNSGYDWNYTSEYDGVMATCHQNPYFEMMLGKMLGGTSSLNYMSYSRGHPRDYKSWATISNDSTWEWENVLPYFMKAEKVEDPNILNSQVDRSIYGTAGNLRITTYEADETLNYFESYKELGHDIYPDVNAKHPLGYTKMKLTLADGVRQSTAYAYLKPIKNRPNLHVMKNTFVTKVIFDENRNAIGVEALTSEDKTIIIKAAKEVIISAGTFNSPKLLLLSGIGPAEQLQSKNIDVVSDLPVGENFQEHPVVTLISNMDENNKTQGPANPHDFPAFITIGYVALNKSQGYPDYLSANFIVDDDLILYFCSYVYRYKNDICDFIYKSGYGRNRFFNKIVNLNPKSRGKISLRSSNPIDPPIIENRYLSHEDDLNNIVKYVKDFSSIIKTKYFKSVNAEVADPTNCGSHEPGSDEYWKCYATCMVNGISHFTSTCSMGSVVDGRLRVMGVQRLRVADASIMPIIPSSEILGPIVMIAEKAADMIKYDNNLLSK